MLHSLNDSGRLRGPHWRPIEARVTDAMAKKKVEGEINQTHRFMTQSHGDRLLQHVFTDAAGDLSRKRDLQQHISN